MAVSGLASSIFTGSVSLEDENKVLENYVLGQRLGEGANGSVYVLKYVPSGENFAVKVLQKADLLQPLNPLLATTAGATRESEFDGSDGEPSSFSVGSPLGRASSFNPADILERHIVQEATVLQSLEHPHVVKFYKFLNSTVAFYFIMELAEGGELFDLIISKHYFTEDEARHYFQQLISAIDFCHRNGVAHKDLKAENLLLSGDDRLLVCDFGFSSKTTKESIDDPALADSENAALHEITTLAPGATFGTLHYMSPEAVIASTQKTFCTSFEDISSGLNGLLGSTAELPASVTDSGSEVASTQCNRGSQSPLTRGDPGTVVMTATESDGKDESTRDGHRRASSMYAATDPQSPLNTQTTSCSPLPLGSRVSPAHASDDEGRFLRPRRHMNHKTSSSTSGLDQLVKDGALSRHGNTSLSSSKCGHSPNKNTTATKLGRVGGGINAIVKSIMSGGGGAGMHNHDTHAGVMHSGASSEANFCDDKDGGRAARGKAAHGTKRHPAAHPERSASAVVEVVTDARRLSAANKGRGGTTAAAGASPLEAAASSRSASIRAKPIIVDPFQQDLWSAGVILFFMLTGRLPFDGRGDEETLYLIQNNFFSFTAAEEERISADARHLVTRMLALEPTDRPTLEQIIRNRWFVQHINLVSDFPHRADLEEKLIESGLLVRQPPAFLDFSTQQHYVTQDEERVLERAFDKIDSDGYGTITRDQLRDMLTTLHGGNMVSKKDVSELVNLFTGNPDSTEISFQQFRKAWVEKDLAHIPYSHGSEFQLANIIDTPMDEVERLIVRQLRIAFDSVDENHTGVIQLEELRRMFERCHIKVQDEELVSLVQQFHERELAVRNDSVVSGLESFTPGEVVPSQANIGISFDAFVVGIVQRDILLRHPMGRKLAAATNLAALFQSHNLTECVRHGFLVVGLQKMILQKLTACPQRLQLLYTDEVVSDTENIYSFRFFNSPALASGTPTSSTALLPQPPPLSAGHAATTSAVASPFDGGVAGFPPQLHLPPLDILPDTQPNPFNPAESAAMPSGGTPVTLSSTSDFAFRPSSVPVQRHALLSSGHPPKDALAGVSDHRPWRKARSSRRKAKDTKLHELTDASSSLRPGHGLPTALTSPSGQAVGCEASMQVSTPQTPSTAPSQSDGEKGECSTNRSSSAIVDTEEPTPTGSTPIDSSAFGASTHERDVQHRAAAAAMKAEGSDGGEAPLSPHNTRPLAKVGQSCGAEARSGVPPLASAPVAVRGATPAHPFDETPTTPTTASASHPCSPGDAPHVNAHAARQNHGDPEAHALRPHAVLPTSPAPPMRHGSLRQLNESLGSRQHDSGASPLFGLPGAQSTTRSSGNYSAASFTHHRGLGLSTSGVAAQTSGSCDVDVILAPACLGYTYVQFRRIHGKTSDFHESVAFVSNLLDVERQQAIEDTMPRGENELM